MTQRFKSKCDDLVRQVAKARTQTMRDVAAEVDAEAQRLCGRLCGPLQFKPKKENA